MAGSASVKSVKASVLKKTKLAYALAATGVGEFSLAAWRGKKVILYFYPKDNTPGCTLEGQDFRRLHHEFESAGCVIFGVSKDSLRTHENFKKKCDFPFDLVSDPEEKLCRQFSVIQMKKLYGREYEGIERSTFVIDEKGKTIKEWRKVKVDGHAQDVLDYILELP